MADDQTAEAKMCKFILTFAIAIALAFSGYALADGIFNPTATTGTSIVGGGEGINNLSIGGSGGGGGGANCLLVSGSTTNCLLVSGSTTNSLLVQ